MTTEAPAQTVTNAQVLETLVKLAEAHPGVYEAEQNTDHKKAAGIDYSYDDCYVGGVLRELCPAKHAEFLAWEAEHSNGFTVYGPSSDARDLVGTLRETFTPDQLEVLSEAQRRQDKAEPWADIAADPRVREALA